MSVLPCLLTRRAACMWSTNAGLTRRAGINNAINTLLIGPISHVGSALPLSCSQTPHINDHVTIWMVMAVTAQLHLPNWYVCSLSLSPCLYLNYSTTYFFCLYTLVPFCYFLSHSVSLWLLQGLWLTILYLMHSYVLMALTIPIIHCLGNLQSITTRWACTTHKVCKLLFIL